LTYFEERDLIVVRTDLTGKRIVVFPDLGCETAPDQPDQPGEDIIPRQAAE